MHLRKPINLSRYMNTGVVDDRTHLPESSKESASYLFAGALITNFTEKDLYFCPMVISASATSVALASSASMSFRPTS